MLIRLEYGNKRMNTMMLLEAQVSPVVSLYVTTNMICYTGIRLYLLLFGLICVEYSNTVIVIVVVVVVVVCVW